MMMGKLFTLLILLLVQACQVSEQISASKQLSTANYPIADFQVVLPANGWSKLGDVIQITLVHNHAIQVTGTPSIKVKIGSNDRSLSYQSGSGTNTIVFGYQVTEFDEDFDGIEISDSIDLDGGSIAYLDATGILSSTVTSLSIPPSTLLVDGVVPTLNSVKSPMAKNYLTDQSLNYALNFSEIIYTKGNPTFDIVLDSSTLQASLKGGSGSKTLSFGYKITSSDLDTDGFYAGGILNLNPYAGVDVVDQAGNSASTAMPYLTSSSIQTNIKNYSLTKVSFSAPQNYSIGQTVYFRIQTKEAVSLNITDKIMLTINTGNIYAKYVSGNNTSDLVFKYVVQSTSEDFSTFSISTPLSVYLSNNTFAKSIKDASLAGIYGTTTAAHSMGETVTFTVRYSDMITLPINSGAYIDLSSGTIFADFVPGPASKEVVFKYTLQNGLESFNAINLPDPFEISSTSSIFINTPVPTILAVTPPSASTYGLAQDMDFSVQFTDPVDVKGVPGLPLSFTSGKVVAKYVSGSGTDTLLFRYTVTKDQQDLDDITIEPKIDLYGGSIIDQSPNTFAAELSFNPPSTSGILVDSVEGPSVLFAYAPAVKTYKTGENLDFTFIFNRPVTITGSPQLQINLGGYLTTTTNAVYVPAMSSGNTVVFRYTVLAGDNDLNGITLSGPIDLNSGSILDSQALPAILSFMIPNTNGIFVDGLNPFIFYVTDPADNTYGPGQLLTFQLEFNEKVIVTGSPVINLTIGASTVNAVYQSGSGSSTLTFSYLVQSGDFDNDGIDILSPLDPNSGSIEDKNGNVMSDFTLTPPITTGILIAGVASSITSISVTPPLGGTFKLNSTIDFTVNWGSDVIISGSPRLVLDIGGQTRYALHRPSVGTSTTTSFRYTVGAGEEDTGGISFLSTDIDYNGGTIVDNYGNSPDPTFPAPSLAAFKVDGKVPTISLVTAPTTQTYIIGDTMTFIVKWSENVVVTGGVPYLAVTMGLQTVWADYVSGSGTDTLTFEYTVLPGDLDNNGVGIHTTLYLDTATIRDAAFNNAALSLTAPNLTGVVVDGVVPIVTVISAPASNTYELGSFVDFTFNWSENMAVTGTPQLTLDVGGVTRYATFYSTGSSGKKTVFRYTVLANDLDTDGITFLGSPEFDSNGGSLKDTAGNFATLTFTPPLLTGVKIDGQKPVVTAQTAPTPGTYKEGQDLDFTVTWSENVTVTGTPSLNLIFTTGSAIQAYYVSGDGTNTLTFRYTVQTGDEDLNGVTLSSTVSLNGGTIQDPVTNDAILNLITTSYSTVKVDGKDPVLTASTTTGSYFKVGSGNKIDYLISFHEPVIVNTTGGVPKIQLTVGATTQYATYVSGSTTSTLTFRYTIGTANSVLDLNGITVAGSITLNGGTIRDSAAHDANTNFTFSEKDYIYYSNILARYNFESGNVNTASCFGYLQCFYGTSSSSPAVKDISGNAKHITSVSSPGPSLGSGFGTQITNYAQFNNQSYFNLPTLTGIRYMFVVMKHVSNPSPYTTYSTHTLLSSTNGTGSPLLSFQSNYATKKTNSAYNMKLRQNGGTIYPLVSTSWTNTFSTPAWQANYKYIYQFWLQSGSTINLTSSSLPRLGNADFNGQIAEIVFMSSASALTQAQIDEVTTQLNAIHGAY